MLTHLHGASFSSKCQNILKLNSDMRIFIFYAPENFCMNITLSAHVPVCVSIYSLLSVNNRPFQVMGFCMVLIFKQLPVVCSQCLAITFLGNIRDVFYILKICW